MLKARNHWGLHPKSQRAKTLIVLVGEKTSSSTICSRPFTPVVDVFLLEVLLWAVEAAFGFAADVSWVVCCDVVLGEFCSNPFGGNTRSAPWRRLLWVILQLSLPQVRAREQLRALWPFPKQKKRSLLSATIFAHWLGVFSPKTLHLKRGCFPLQTGHNSLVPDDGVVGCRFGCGSESLCRGLHFCCRWIWFSFWFCCRAKLHPIMCLGFLLQPQVEIEEART